MCLVLLTVTALGACAAWYRWHKLSKKISRATDSTTPQQKPSEQATERQKLEADYRELIGPLPRILTNGTSFPDDGTVLLLSQLISDHKAALENNKNKFSIPPKVMKKPELQETPPPAEIAHNMTHDNDTKPKENKKEVELERNIDNKSHHQDFQGLRDTPPWIQDASTANFEKVRTMRNSSRDKSPYCLMGIDNTKLIKHVIMERNHNNKDVYIVGVNHCEGDWGKKTYKIAQSIINVMINANTAKVHIFSLTNEKGESDTKQNNSATRSFKNRVYLYEWNKFNIEDIEEELKRRGHSLKQKVNLMFAARWTLYHLVNPLGTLKQMYALLSSQRGMLLSGAFIFSNTTSGEIEKFPGDTSLNFLEGTNAIPLFHERLSSLTHEFLLVRPNEKELELPLAYDPYSLSGFETLRQTHPYPCKTAILLRTAPGITNSRQEKSRQHVWTITKEGEELEYYCSSDNEQSKELYQSLQAEKLLGTLYA